MNYSWVDICILYVLNLDVKIRQFPIPGSKSYLFEIKLEQFVSKQNSKSEKWGNNSYNKLLMNI